MFGELNASPIVCVCFDRITKQYMMLALALLYLLSLETLGHGDFLGISVSRSLYLGRDQLVIPPTMDQHTTN